MSENSHDEPQRPNTAIALQFDGFNAPVVTARGDGHNAERIIQIAREHDIPLHQDRDLTRVLSCIPLGDEIPAEAFTAVAEILAYIYYLDDIASD